MALTKVSGGILDPGIDVAGIVTATGFDGPFTGGSSRNVTAGVGTFTGLDVNGNGDISGNLVVGGNLTANGDFTTLNTTLREVEILRVDADSTATAGIITQRGTGNILELYDTSTNVLTVKDGGKVGIGTDNPDSLLHLHSSSPILQIEDVTGTQNQLTRLLQVGAGFRVQLRNGNNNGSLTVQGYGNAQTTNFIRVENDGKVGIGTDDPASRLEIYDNSSDIGGLIHVTQKGTGDAAIDFQLVGTREYTLGIDNSDSDKFKLAGSAGLGSNDLVTVTTAGNVGIGTDNPETTFEVVGTGVSVFNSAKDSLVDISGAGKIELIRSDSVSYIDFKTSLTEDFDCRIQQYSNGLRFFTGGNGSTDERLRITSDGNVLIDTIVTTEASTDFDDLIIGSTSDTAKGISIVGSTTGGVGSLAFTDGESYKNQGVIQYRHADDSMRFTTAQYERLRITSGGVVGIGTTNPTGAQKLHVYADSNGTGGLLQITQQGTGDAAIDFQLKGTREYSLGIDNSDSDKFKLSSTAGLDSNTLLTVTTAGEVGIGTANPQMKLVVSANGNGIEFNPKVGGTNNHRILAYDRVANVRRGLELDAQSFEYRKDLETRLKILSDGKVGIGTDDPDYGLHVYGAGDILVEDSSNGSAHLRLRSSNNGSDVSNWKIKTGSDNHLYIENDTVGGAAQVTFDPDANLSIRGEYAAAQDYPTQKPTLNFNFTTSKKLDSRFTYQRTGSASFTDEFGKVVLVGSNVPRFDHDPLTKECKGLLIEQSRTNYVLDSLNFRSIHWSFGINHPNGADKIAVDNSVTNPDGSVGAYYRTSTDETYTNDPYCDLSGANTDTITVSLFVKERSGVSGAINIEIFSQINPSAVSLGAFAFDPATATVSTGDANFSDGRVQEFPNGWYRVSAKVTTNSGNFTSTSRMDIQSTNHYMWGPQLEEGSFPTSFIPTNGRTATRGTENVKIDGDNFTDFYNPIESTVVCEFDSSNWLTNNHNSYERIWAINNGSESDVIEMFKENTVSDAIRFRVRDGNVNVLGAANISYGTNTTPKMAFAVKLNDAAAAVDGTISGTTDTDIPMPTVDRLILGNDDDSNQNSLNGYIRKFIYYPVKLPDSQVITLTS